MSNYGKASDEGYKNNNEIKFVQLPHTSSAISMHFVAYCVYALQRQVKLNYVKDHVIA